MGIKQLIPLLQKSVPHLFADLYTPNVADLYTPNVAAHLSNKRIAIDATILLFRFWHASTTPSLGKLTDGASPLSAEPAPPSDTLLNEQHLVQCFYNLFEYCRHINAKPILVFDHGSRPLPKQKFIHPIRNKNRSRQVQLRHSAVHLLGLLNPYINHLDKKPVLVVSEPGTDPAVPSPPPDVTEHIATIPPLPHGDLKSLNAPGSVNVTLSVGPDMDEKRISELTRQLFDMKLTDTPIINTVPPTELIQPDVLKSQLDSILNAQSATPTRSDKHADNIMNKRTNLHQIGLPLLEVSATSQTKTTTTNVNTLKLVRDKVQCESSRLERLIEGPPIGIIRTVMDLSRHCNVPVLLTPDLSEAEQVCAALVDLGEADYVVSDDSDASIFYPHVQVIKDFFKFHTRPYVFGPVTQVPEMIGLLDTSHNSLIDLCILSGCDYSSKIPSIAITRALNLLKTYPSIEAVLSDRADLAKRVQDDPLWQPANARAVFQNQHLDTNEILLLANEAKILANDLSVTDDRFNKFPPLNPVTVSGWDFLDYFNLEPFDAHAYQKLLLSIEPKYP